MTIARASAWLLAIAVAAQLGGCREPGARLTRQARSLASDAVSPSDRAGEGASCGLPFQGCCDGETLWWCDGGALNHLDCTGRPRCGWSNDSLYDCNTSGGQDPTGAWVKECSLLPVKLPPTDGGHGEGGAACGGVTREGCCSGQTLFYCDEGQLRMISCSLNPLCGWRAGARGYDCGTEGASDPSGRFPAQCPAGLPEVGPPLVDLEVSPPDGARSDLGDGGVPRPGCACDAGRAAGGLPSALPVVAVLLALALLIRSSRRSVRAEAQHQDRSRRRH